MRHSSIWYSSFRALSAVSALTMLAGCNLDSYMDPTRTGHFENYATTIPVLDRIDVIEQLEDPWARATDVMPEDLVPSELEYYLYPGDLVTVSIYELFAPNNWATTTRRIDAGGNYRVSEIGDVRAAGLTPQQFQDEVGNRLMETVFTPDNPPQVDVVVEEGGGLRYTIYGYLQQPSMYTLVNPDLRLLDALAIAGGIPVTTEYVYVIRTVPLTEEVIPRFDPRSGEQPLPRPAETQPADIEDLIERMEEERRNQPPATAPGRISPGMVRDWQDAQDPQDPPAEPPIVDIDELQPVRVSDQPPVDIDEMRPATRPGDEDSFIFDPQRGEWVRVRGDAGRDQPDGERRDADQATRRMVGERIIRINYQRLSQGDTSLNIVIRPNDRIYVAGPLQGFVYIGGEINRPGVYSLPSAGTLTLSRFIDVAGGLGAVAIPQRIDLTRRIGHNREATVMLDVASIRQRKEPDIVLKPDDHIIVGTSFWATPLAIIRNGFRATYGFGFLLDRNFGSDVFGAPPDQEGF